MLDGVVLTAIDPVLSPPTQHRVEDGLCSPAASVTMMLARSDRMLRMERMSGILIRRREQVLVGEPSSVLRRAVRRGDLVRVTAGVYLDSMTWQSLEPMEQHRQRVLATAERLSTAPVFSHFAAAALWGIRILGRWPALVDVTLERASGGRSDGLLRRHCTGLEATEVVMLDGLAVTSAAQTVVDLARILPFADAVVAMDSALHLRRMPAPLAAPDDIAQIMENFIGRHGYGKAAAVTEFATGLSDSVEESHSRVHIHLLGFPKPELQREFTLSNGRKAKPDFYWPVQRHIGECDGRSKYSDPKFLQGRTPQQAFFDEKERENELRRQVRAFSRWEPRELYPPRRLYDRLLRDGLPSTRRRP
jgi:hypothetical protein